MPIYGWKMTGNPSDAMLAELDSMIYNYANPDSIYAKAEEYCRASRKEDSRNQYEHRRLYWEGTALFMKGEYEKGDSLRRMALLKCDSLRFPHDFLVCRYAIEQPTDFPDNASRYERYSDDLRHFLDFGDLGSAFSRAVQLSQLMSMAGMNERALSYALEADSLLDVAGLQIMRVNNKANIASCLFNAGDTIAAVKTLSSLKSNSLKEVSSVDAIVNFNIFQMNGDEDSLLAAWRQVKNEPELRKMRPLIAAAMVKSGLYKESGNGSYDDFMDLLEESSDYSYLPEEELYIRDAMCDIVAVKNPSALPLALKAYQASVESYHKELKRGEVISAEIKDEISEAETKAAERHQESIRIFWIILAALITICGLTVILLILRINKLRQVELLTQIEVEQNKRRRIASEMRNINRDCDAPSGYGVGLNMIDENCASPITPPEATNPETARQEGHINITDEQMFISEFMKAYPKVGKTGRRLASYIWQGLDSVAIAKEMNIRKESVMQARWRLRGQMGLLPEDDLEVMIIGLARRRLMNPGISEEI